jgi:hypothetical protein
MTDLELFKAIVRATRNVAVEDVPKALARVRALLAESAPAAPARKYFGGRDRMEKAGSNRSGGEDDAA